MLRTSPECFEAAAEMRSVAVLTVASSASAGRMSMHSYSLKPHLLWSGRPPREGEQEVLRGRPAVYGTCADASTRVRQPDSGEPRPNARYTPDRLPCTSEEARAMI